MSVATWWNRQQREAHPVTGWMLRVLSFGYALGYWLRRLWLRRRVAAKVQGPLVVSIGNLTVGGTGKTPAALAVARHFLARKKKVSFLSRGYGRQVKTEPLRVTADSRFEEAGDEPLLLARALPKAGVVVDSNRARGARWAVADHGAQVIVLDDGFQQRLFLKRDLDILLFDGRAEALPLGGARLLPAGPLREPLAEGRAADALLFSHCGSRAEAARALASLPSYFYRKPVFWGVHQPAGLSDLSGRRVAIKRLAKLKVAALSGLAQPAGFEHTLEQLGARVILPLRFKDHHAYAAAELEQAGARARAAGAAALVTTEKDAVRFPRGFKAGLPVWVLSIRFQIEPRRAFAALLDGAMKREGRND